MFKKIKKITQRAINSLFQVRRFVVLEKNFDDIYEKLKYYLALHLTEIFNQKMDKNTSEVLAVQVMLYLMGADLTYIYETRDKEIQKEIDSIKHLIEPNAKDIMINYDEIKELVIRVVVMKQIVYKSRYGEEWINTKQFKNTTKIFELNENEYKNSIDINEFLLCAKGYLEKQNLKKNK